MATNKEGAAQLTRALGTWDLTWLCVAAIANLNLVPVIAASGPTTVWLWLLALCFFFVPQGMAVIELSQHMPGEGGIYLWAKDSFGDFHGFLCGWCYWTTNMFFVPTLLFYLTGTLTYAGGPALAKLAENQLFFFSITTGLLWLASMANIFGGGVGKWVSNAGGFGTLVTAVSLIGLGVVTVVRQGPSLKASSFAIGHMDWPIVSTFGVICFGLVGLELGPVMGDEIRDPKKTVPRGTMFGGAISGTLYVGATLALLVAVRQQDVKVVQGVMQAVDKMAGGIGAGWIVAPLAVLLGVSITGSTSAWVSGSARILFVSGIDRYLPKMFGRVHPKYHSPHIALIAMAALSSALVSMSFVGGSTVREAYQTLLDLSVVLQMISYLYLYGALMNVAFGKTHRPAFFGRTKLRIAAVSGLATTVAGGVVAFVPSRQIDSIWRFELKMVGTCVLFLALAGGLFWYYSRKKTLEEGAATLAA